MLTNQRNLQYTASGMIEMLVDHPDFGTIPFAASPIDSEAHGRDLYARAIAGEFGPIAPYVEPVKTPAQIQYEVQAEARQYLQSTDWYFARLAETGESVPQDVLTKRAEARAKLQ